jgi:hypothetical protein
MGHGVLAVVAGIVAGGSVALLIEIPGMVMYPLPPGTEMSNSNAIKSHMANAPMAALMGVALAWTIAPLVGSWIAALIARRAFFAHGLMVGAFFLAADVLNVRSFPHPTWLAVVGVVAPIVSSCLGASLAAQMAGRSVGGAKPYDMREKNVAC